MNQSKFSKRVQHITFQKEVPLNLIHRFESIRTKFTWKLVGTIMGVVRLYGATTVDSLS